MIVANLLAPDSDLAPIPFVQIHYCPLLGNTINTPNCIRLGLNNVNKHCGQCRLVVP